MGLIDVQPVQPTAEMGARRCRMALRGAVDRATQACNEVRQVIERHGRQQVIAALGDDAAAMQTLYGELKTLAGSYGRDVPDLPDQ